MSEKTYTASEVGWITLMSPFLLAVVVIATFPFAAIDAFVTMKLWNWFPASYFHLGPIDYWMTLGVLFTVGMFKSSRHVKGEKIDWKGMIIGGIAGPWIMLGLGYLIHLKVS